MREPGPGTGPIPGSRARMANRRILLVEDSFLIGLTLRDVIGRAGASVIGPFVTVADALSAIAGSTPDAAVLDIRLGTGTSVAVAEALATRGVPFLFMTGYNTTSLLPPSLRTVRTLSKPVRDEQLLAALEELLAESPPA